METYVCVNTYNSFYWLVIRAWLIAFENSVELVCSYKWCV